MRQFYLPITFFVFVSSLLSCSIFRHSEEHESEKLEPYDQFAFQRSFPDKDFDWKGWKNSMVDIRMATKAKSKTSDCSGNTGNWTEQGPANVGGRCNTLAVKPDDENTVLAGFAGGGIFKSTDAGVNWHPVFDDHLELCIGHIIFDPNDPNVVYAGTGDPNLPSIVFNGDGVFKSTDAGETWSYLGLSEQGIISKIVVNPVSPKTLLAACMGNPYVRDDQRGIYKSTDGGEHWQQVLFVSNQAGASDLVQSPVNPNILYASFWDRIRSNSESIIYGPNAKVFKSSDGGNTWVQMKVGLPNGVMGRTGLAISQQNPDKAYAIYVDSLSTTGGLYKTVDGGASWTPVNVAALEDAGGDFSWYFGKIRINPLNDDDLYFLAILLYRKAAGSSNWAVAGGGHADSHDVVFCPSGRRYWSNDGGVYRIDAGQSTWTKCKNLPVTQFYHTNFNPHTPNLYWGGAQDNGIQKGVGGASINNWTSVFSADGFRCAFDPDDPLTFWVEIQNGTIHKTTDGGSSWQFGSTALGTTDRVSWDAPFFLSRFSPTRLYSATYRAYVSSGSGWGAISPDLTDGVIYSPRFHTITALQESPKFAQKLMAGTSDGNVWRREANGNWINITGNLPDRYVTAVELSTTQEQRLFVTHSGFRNDEYIPHVHRSDDNGANWKDISGDLPQMPVNDLYIMPDHGDSVLFVATDAGVYFSKNAGQNWGRLGGNMPVIPVFDLEANPVRKELVAATYARGIWTFPFDSVFSQHAAVLVNVSGTIQTEAGVGVNAVHLGTETSELNGTYQVSNVPGCSTFMLSPYRNDNVLNGLTTYDLVLISKHILGIEPLGSPFKMIAADANRSNTITTFDIVALRKLILGIDVQLSGNTSWRFVPKNHDFLNPANPFLNPIPETLEVPLQMNSVTNLDFTAIKVGDVNNSVIPDMTTYIPERSIGFCPLDVQDGDFEQNEAVEMVFQGDMSAISAMQFTLNFDTASLIFERFEPMTESVAPDNFASNRSKQGLLSIAISTETDAMTGKSPLFKIIFKAKKSGQLHQSLRIDSWPTPALVFRKDGSAYVPTLWDNTKSGSIVVAPNPFGQAGTWFEFLPDPLAKEPVNDHLEIYDKQGKRLFTKSLQGSERFHVGREVFSNTGIYFWKLSISGQSGKLLLTP